MTGLVTLNHLFFLALGAMSASACTQGSDCKLPDCFCPTFDHPDFTDTKDIPQMVYFGFDDALTAQVDQFYQQLFTDSRVNPNGCPITMSLYVQDQYTIYSLVENNYKRGNEIGSHSVNHINVDTAEKLQFEAGQQKENIINKGGVGRSDVVGWRSPNLQTAGDSQPDVLKSLNYTYDISLTYTRQSNNRVPWPYTLDFGYPYSCSVPPCPQSSHPGFWEIPVFSLMDPESGFPCAYVDSCRPTSEAAALNYLWTNFEQVYNSNRAPFGLNMHAAWFFFDDYIKATHAFLDKLLQLDDVYIISAQKVLDWMRSPVKASEIPSKMPSWGCANPLPRSSTPRGLTKKPNMGNVFPPLTTSTPPKPSPTAAPTTTISPTTTTTTTTTTTPPPTTPKVKPTTLANSLPVDISAGNGSCIQGANCFLPSCQCRSVNPPGGLSPSNTPQIVYLTFSGRVDVLNFQPVLDLLTSRRNSNNCSLGATLFTPAQGNFVPYVQGLRSRGSEVGMYGKDGYQYTATPSVEQQVTDQLAEFAAQNTNIRLKPEAGGWHRGWRSPQDSIVGDEVLRALSKGGVLYDSSIPIVRRRPYKDLVPWSYTLDFGFQDACPMGQRQCPTTRYPGLWEVPLVPLLDTRKEYTCSFVDACTQNQPRSAEETYKYLLENFDFNYNQNRAPFGVNLRRDWLTHPFYAANLKGLAMFLDTVLQERAGVHVMSIEKMLDWMRKPTGLDRIDSFLPWKCGS